MCAKLSNEDVDFTLSRLFRCTHYLDYFGALLVKSSVRQGIRTYSEIGYVMCNFINKMQGVKEKATPWYSRGGREVDMRIVMAMFHFDFVDLQSTKWSLPIDKA